VTVKVVILAAAEQLICPLLALDGEEAKVRALVADAGELARPVRRWHPFDFELKESARVRTAPWSTRHGRYAVTHLVN